MILSNKLYHSKLLLFGEYTVTLGSGALAKPLPTYGGRWTASTLVDNTASNLNFLADALKNDQTLSSIYDTYRFRDEIDQGLVFDSSIPQGYGLGSSGALVAALYDRFALNKTEDIPLLKKILGSTENIFHGNSSGIDPLVSYLNVPVWIESSGKITKIDKKLKCSGFFVVDTNLPRKTEPLVQWFKRKVNKHAAFKSGVTLLASINQLAIQSILDNDQQSLLAQMKQISMIQSDLFINLIPDDFRSLWKIGLDSEKYFMKICGAGGGGMMLGYTQDRPFVYETFAAYNVTFTD